MIKTLGTSQTVQLQNITNVHLHQGLEMDIAPTNSKKMILIFQIVGFGILLIALVNYLNLISARIVRRSKEVGVRKVLGSSRRQIKWQFVLESVLFTVISLIIALPAVYTSIPVVENLIGQPIFNTVFDHFRIWLIVAGIIFFGAFISGYYPAFFISKFRITAITKGKLGHTKAGRFIRRSLVTAQFCFAILLISCIYVVYSQIRYMLDQDLKIDIDKTLVVNCPSPSLRSSDYETKIRTLKNQIINISEVSEVSISSLVPGERNGFLTSVERGGPQLMSTNQISRVTADENYLELYDIGILAGRGFSEQMLGDRNVVVISESAITALGFDTVDEALQSTIVFPGNQTFRIIGLMEDYFQNGLQSQLFPMVINLDSAMSSNRLSLKVNSSKYSQVIEEVQSLYQDFFPSVPFEYSILKESFDKQYDADRQLGKILVIFTSIAIIIAILGIVGLTAFVINQKMKEISLRKVLGSNLRQLFLLINQEYIVLSLIASSLTLPFAYFLMDQWLNDFAYHITISWLFFLLPLIAINLVILGTTWKLVINANRVNPAVILKEE